MGILYRKLLFVFVMLVVYRIGTYITLPGIDSFVLSRIASQNAHGVLGMFNMFTGGALGRMSIFALNIMPYITASILMQLLTILVPTIGALKSEGNTGRQLINKYTKYLALCLAVVQAFGITVGAEGMSFEGMSLVAQHGFLFRFIGTTSMVGGTMLVIWMTNQITTYGIGNGSSLIIFTGIVSGLPSALVSLFEMGKSGAISTTTVLLMIAMCALMLCTIIFFEKAQRRIPVQYPKRQVVRRGAPMQHDTYLPLKINIAGVLPPIFASSLLLFPSTVITLLADSGAVSPFAQKILYYLSHGKLLYVILFVGLIFFFSFFYSKTIFNAEDTSNNLKKSGAIVATRRPGQQTVSYLESIVARITFIGAMYLSFICVAPEILMVHYHVPFYLGGTSLLIIVNVVIEFSQQIQAHVLSNQYGKLELTNGMLFKRS